MPERLGVLAACGATPLDSVQANERSPSDLPIYYIESPSHEREGSPVSTEMSSSHATDNETEPGPKPQVVQLSVAHKTAGCAATCVCVCVCVCVHPASPHCLRKRTLRVLTHALAACPHRL